MDGIHDVGGKQGYGAIDVDETDLYEIGEAFHHHWEAREWGISRCARTPAITIDWWRHCRELILPVDYLERPYFDSWAQTDFATYIDGGFFTLDEVCSGHSNLDNNQLDEAPPKPMSKADAVMADRQNTCRFDADINEQPLFAIGDVVITNKHGHSGHTRLPQYARNCIAKIHALNGAHVFPDLSAQGKETHQHLYSVVFETGNLWPDSKNKHDKVYLDLWESYLTTHLLVI
jgi:nitrile hydratase beta subunit